MGACSRSQIGRGERRGALKGTLVADQSLFDFDGCSLLFEHNPRSGALHPTSGYGLDELRVDPWVPEPGEASLVTQTFTRRGQWVDIYVNPDLPRMPQQPLRVVAAR